LEKNAGARQTVCAVPSKNFYIDWKNGLYGLVYKCRRVLKRNGLHLEEDENEKEDFFGYCGFIVSRFCAN
jgi:TorA maturation chaperone TorD